MLKNAYVAAAVRCAPPDNKPSPSEQANCRPYFERELEILRLLRSGKSMAEIAGIINVSYKTVANSCAVLKRKLGARTPLDLVRIAVENKLA